MRKIFLFFAAILCAMSVQGANTMRIYCKQAQSWWKSDGAAVGAYYWGTGGNANSWPGTRMNKVSDQTDLWYIDVDIDKYQNIIFTRVPGSGTVSDWGAKTGDLTIANTKNQYTISSTSAVWGNPGVTGSWGTYKPTSTAALATSVANIFVGGQATLTPSLTSNTSANTIKGTAYAISPEGANVSGNTFTATAEGTYTVTATVTYYPLGCPTLTSTATATTTIVAEVPAEETHDVTVSYMCGSTQLQDPTTINTVGVETSVKITAPEIAKYTFANWTLGADVATTDDLTSNAINITTKAGGSDFTLVANYEKAKLTYTVTVPAGTENCYLVGAMNGWDVANPIEMTKQGENVFTTTLEGVATTDEYKYISQKGSWDYADVQDANRTWTANDVVTAWKDPLATNVYLVGNMFDNWDKTPDKEFRKTTKDATTASIVVALDADKDYELKVRRGDDWTSCTSKITNTVTGLQFSSSNGDNCQMKTTVAGEYTFTWTISSSKLDVKYPTLYAVTATANDAAMGTVAGAGTYTHGTEVTLTATPDEGYEFVNWTVAGEEVADEATYTFVVKANVELVANFKKHETTINCVPEGDLAYYVSQAHAGDTLLLADGTYDEAYSIAFDKEGLVVMAAEGAKPVIALTGEWTALNVSASTTFDGITFDGTNVAKYIIATLDSTAMTTDLTIENCEFKNWLQWAISNQYEKNVSANSVVIDNCLFHDGTNSAVYFSENAPEGKHACQDLKVTNSTFYNIGNASSYATVYSLSNANAVDVKIDVTVDFCTFYNCQAKNTDHGAVRVSCAATISNTIIVAPESQGTYRAIYAADYSNAQAINCLTFNYEKDNGGIRSAASKTDCYLNVDPLFVDAVNGDFNLQPGSPAIGKATDGSNLGDPRWKVAATEFALTMNAPAENVEATDLYIITWNVLDPNGDATIKLEYKTEEGDWTTIAEDIPSNIYAYNWNIRKMPAQTVSIRGTLANATESVESIATGTLTIIPDTVAPCTVHELTGNVSATTLTLAWINPNQEYTKTTTVETFEENTFEEYTSGAATSTITISDDKTEATIAYTASAWEDAGIKIPVNLNNVSSFSCEMKGSASNMRVTIEQNGYDWWYKNTAVSDENWTNYTFNSFKSLSWHWTENKEIPATFDGTNVTAIYFPFSAGEGGEGTFAIRNLSITTSAPAVADYAKTIICASLTDYPTSIVAEEVVYEGTASTCDLTIDPTKDYYVSVFAQDDLGNTSVAAQYLYTAPVTYTVAATAVNGTVTGGGTYNHGEEVTLTATPAFDYQFVKWSNESTENPLTITVADDVTLEAIFAEVTATEKKESGVFSISAHKTATFATGNLQYNVGTDTWRFAKQQYQVVGEQNINLGDPAFTGWIDMLGWSNGEANNYGVNPSNKNEDYAGEFVDWGTKMGEGWSTLAAEEWSYLLNTRENAASLKQIAKVDTILGILLFPDGWVMPEDVVVEAEMDEYFEVNIYNYTLEQWTKLEQAGAIFLPAAGRRAGGYGNMINYDQVEETNPENLNGGFYRHQDNTNIYCYYWTSTINAESKVSYLHNVLALGNDEYTIGNGAIWSEKGRYGQSVRLAKVTYDKHEVTVTSENGTITGAGEYTHGDIVTLTATPAEHYVFVNWTKGEEVVAETAEYTFTVEADVELVANFKLDSHTITATAENGTVEGAGTYEHGAEVILTATANEGYEFVKWSNESTENPLTITVTEDVTISAIFQEVIPVITYTVKWYTAVGTSEDATLEEGATITKPATDPEMEGYVFMGWTDECFVAEDGSDFTAIEDFGTADADKEYYAVFAVETTTGGGGDEIIEKSYTFSGYTAGTQYAENETHQLDNDVTIYTTQCHFTTQLRIYSSSTHDGYVISNQLPGNIISMSFNMGNKIDNLAVYGSTDGSTWTEVGKVATTSESYKDYEISFGSTNYTYFKLDVAGSNQIRIAKMGIIYATAVAGEPTTTYSNYMTTCTPEEYTIEWSVNGEVTETTTVVEGDALVLPEAPAAPDACSEKVFMGWATTATVNADGSAIKWVNDTIVPESDKTYYAVFATKTVDEENSEAGSVTLAYKGGTTTNMTVDSNNAAIVGLKAEEWSVIAARGSNNNAPGLNTAGDIRLYYGEDGSNTITVSSLVEDVTISNITITYTEDKYSNSKVLVNDAVVTGTDGTYNINANSFVITNGNTSNVQVRITKIVIEYAKPAVNYSDYATTCEILEYYTITFDYNMDAGYITVNDKRINEKVVTYAEGTVLTVKALTFKDWRFDAWEDEGQNELTTTPEYTFPVTGDVVLQAIFTYEEGAVGTGVENNNVVSSKTMKVIQNGRLMIIREGKTYNAQGQMIE